MAKWKKQKRFGQRVREALERRQWSIRALALLVDCSEGYLGRLLRGEQEPTWSLAVAIADALDVKVDALTDW